MNNLKLRRKRNKSNKLIINNAYSAFFSQYLCKFFFQINKLQKNYATKKSYESYAFLIVNWFDLFHFLINYNYSLNEFLCY